MAEVHEQEDGQRHAYLDHAQGLLVLHPDVLLSGGGQRGRGWGGGCLREGGGAGRPHCTIAIPPPIGCRRPPPPPPKPHHNTAGTSITTALQCARRAWLQDRFAGDSSDKAVLGTLLHELVQGAMHAAMQGREVTRPLLEQQASAWGPHQARHLGLVSRLGHTCLGAAGCASSAA